MGPDDWPTRVDRDQRTRPGSFRLNRPTSSGVLSSLGRELELTWAALGFLPCVGGSPAPREVA